MAWSGVGRASMSAVMAPGTAGRTRLRVRVARSPSRLRKLWTGRPSGVRFLPALARAAFERWARDGRGTAGFGGGRVVVVEEHHVPLDVVGEHAEEDVGADAPLEAVVDGPHLEIHPLEAAEGALDPAEALVGPDRVFGPELLGATLVRIT